MRDFAGRTAFITGGGSGIGLGMARAFAARGMKIVIADLHQDHLDAAEDVLRGEGAEVLGIRVNVVDREAMRRAAQTVAERFGPLHLLCNNAGVFSTAQADVEDYKDWDWIIDVDLKGVVNGLVNFLPLIKAHGQGGHVVNTSSISGIAPFSAGGGVYSAAKYGVTGLTDCLRLNLATHGIGVSLLCPGTVRTNLPLSEKSRLADLELVAKDGVQPELPPGMASAMDPLEAGERVVRAIEANQPYIFTHGEFRDAIREHFESVLACFPQEDFGADRIAAEARRRAALDAARQAAARVGG
ncbi:MAG: SDR family NAD(P)-dependent oxidoreductase [Sphingomonas sp.]